MKNEDDKVQLKGYLKYKHMGISFLRQKGPKTGCIETVQSLYQK